MDVSICQGFRNIRRIQFSFIFQAVTACSLNVILQFTPNLLQGVLNNRGNAPSAGFFHYMILYFVLLLHAERQCEELVGVLSLVASRYCPREVSQYAVEV